MNGVYGLTEYVGLDERVRSFRPNVSLGKAFR